MSTPLRRESAAWSDVELLDSGSFEKYERYGEVTMVRPEPQALWAKAIEDPSWKNASLVYRREGREGEWEKLRPVPAEWTVRWEDLSFRLRPTSFKHIGLFPEQASNWQFLRSAIKGEMKLLNLFGYTGGATLAAASKGASVVHVDGSKPAVTWARENAELSGLSERDIRYIVDDVQKFVAREIRRGNTYDAIIMDPPAFGRGPDGELWKFDDHLPQLLLDCAKLLSKERGMLLINAYSLGYPALAIENLVRTNIPFVQELEAIELTLKESSDRGFELPTGIAIRGRW